MDVSESGHAPNVRLRTGMKQQWDKPDKLHSRVVEGYKCIHALIHCIFQMSGSLYTRTCTKPFNSILLAV